MSSVAEYNRDHYDQLAAEHAETVIRASNQRRAWLEGNADRAAALLPAEREANIDDHLALRDELTDRLGSSELLLARDAHARDIAAPAPELMPTPPAVEVDIDLDFGP